MTDERISFYKERLLKWEKATPKKDNGDVDFEKMGDGTPIFKQFCDIVNEAAAEEWVSRLFGERFFELRDVSRNEVQCCEAVPPEQNCISQIRERMSRKIEERMNKP